MGEGKLTEDFNFHYPFWKVEVPCVSFPRSHANTPLPPNIHKREVVLVQEGEGMSEGREAKEVDGKKGQERRLGLAPREENGEK